MRVDLGLDLLRAAHPGLGPDRPRPVGKAGDEARILAYMLFADPAGRDDPARRQGQGFPVDLLGHYIDRVGQNRLRGYRGS